MTIPNPSPELERFEIVFARLHEALSEESGITAETHPSSEVPIGELREIDELRRYASEVARPELTFFSGT